MATIVNRSRYTVQAKRRPDLLRSFPFNKREAARAYLLDLRAEGHKAEITQGEDILLVRIRQKGFPEMTFTASSHADAETSIRRIESERATGLFVDYTKAHRVSLAKLISEYLEDPVVMKQKGYKDYAYTLNGMIDDSLGILARGARRTPRRSMTWLQKPLASVNPEDIQAYVNDRLDDGVAAATVDRELDHLSSIINWSIKYKRIHLNCSPMVGVRRPKYYNERDRLLADDERERLLAAARDEDRSISPDLWVELHLAPARASALGLPNASARKRFIATERAKIVESFSGQYPTVRLLETLIVFLLATAARRGEALALTWSNVDLIKREAFLPTTKNGRARTLPLREHVIELLNALPRISDRVFPITVDNLKSAWSRMCKRANLSDFHLHDLRHAATTSIAEAFMLAGQPLSTQALATITGHLDHRCLARYCHMSAGLMARQMDAVFSVAERRGWRSHKGRLYPKRNIGAGSVPHASPGTSSPAPVASIETTESVDRLRQVLEGPSYNVRPV